MTTGPNRRAVTVIASTAAAQADADEGNLGEKQVLIRAADLHGPFIPEADVIDELLPPALAPVLETSVPPIGRRDDGFGTPPK